MRLVFTLTAVGLLLLGVHGLLLCLLVFLRVPLLFQLPAWAQLLAPALALLCALRVAMAPSRPGLAAVLALGLALALFWSSRTARAGFDTPRRVGRWAQTTIAQHPCPESICWLQREALPPFVRALGPTYVHIAKDERGAAYVSLDWGGGHIDPVGLMAGPSGFEPQREEVRQKKLHDGVWLFRVVP